MHIINLSSTNVVGGTSGKLQLYRTKFITLIFVIYFVSYENMTNTKNLEAMRKQNKKIMQEYNKDYYGK